MFDVCTIHSMSVSVKGLEGVDREKVERPPDEPAATTTEDAEIDPDVALSKALGSVDVPV